MSSNKCPILLARRLVVFIHPLNLSFDENQHSYPNVIFVRRKIQVVLAVYFGTFMISKYVILAVFWAARTNERRSQFSVFSVFGAIGIYAHLPLCNRVNELYLL